MKICSKLCVIHIFNKVTSWPHLISKFLVAHIPVCNVASDWSRTFYTEGVLSILFKLLLENDTLASYVSQSLRKSFNLSGVQVMATIGLQLQLIAI